MQCSAVQWTNQWSLCANIGACAPKLEPERQVSRTARRLPELCAKLGANPVSPSFAHSPTRPLFHSFGQLKEEFETSPTGCESTKPRPCQFCKKIPGHQSKIGRTRVGERNTPLYGMSHRHLWIASGRRDCGQARIDFCPTKGRANTRLCHRSVACCLLLVACNN